MTDPDVEREGRAWLEGEVKKNVVVDLPRCYENPDPRHWRCVTDFHRKARPTTHITFTATCDDDRCTFKIVFEG